MTLTQLAKVVLVLCALQAIASLGTVVYGFWLAFSPTGDPVGYVVGLGYALHLLIDLFALLAVRQGALESAAPANHPWRAFLLVVYLLQMLIYGYIALNLLGGPAVAARALGAVVGLRAGAAVLTFSAIVVCLSMSRNQVDSTSGPVPPPDAAATGLDEDQLPGGWDEAHRSSDDQK
ncbi:MAG: hypothetical protein ACREJ2_04580 [Planctomycetota bacterium]